MTSPDSLADEVRHLADRVADYGMSGMKGRKILNGIAGRIAALEASPGVVDGPSIVLLDTPYGRGYTTSMPPLDMPAGRYAWKADPKASAPVEYVEGEEWTPELQAIHEATLPTVLAMVHAAPKASAPVAIKPTGPLHEIYTFKLAPHVAGVAQIVAWMDDKGAWPTCLAPQAGLHALVLADDHARIVSAERETFQLYVDANEARLDAEQRASQPDPAPPVAGEITQAMADEVLLADLIGYLNGLGTSSARNMALAVARMVADV